MAESQQQIRSRQLLFKPHYDIEKGYLMNFITNYQDKYMESDETYGQNKYMYQLQKVANGQQKTIEILFEDLEEYFHGEQDEKFLNQIRINTKRYISLFCEVVDQVMPARNIPLQEDEEIPNLEIQNQQRQNFLQQNETQTRANQNFTIPAALKRKYELILINGPNSKQNMIPLRQLKASLLGSHVTIKSQVLRCSEVSPMMQVATYICDACGYEIYQQINSRTFTPLVDCVSQICQTNRTRGKLIPTNQASKFIAYQEIMVQETTDLVPVGNIPRTFKVVAKGNLTYQCSPGDTVVIQGIFLPTENETFEGLKSLVNDTHLEALKITREKKKYMDLFLTNDIEQQLTRFVNKYKVGERYNMLAGSIAPEIYGLENVKKALLLQMIGGYTKEMDDGMKIRGDIHLALIGDPGLAKSQLLKFIATISPRGIYTTGKGNTGAGLTVAVLRDPITNEVTLEGGALVLSDMGVCCIDEFDKMNDHDKTAIHEVMEQQTVSIAKAGITATLNTRTSVLAAANPSYGRYDRKLTPHANINLPAALLSRFDLIFLLLDTRDEINDNLLASHICHVHQTGKPPQTVTESLDVSFIRAFISRAKMYSPILEPEVQKYMEEKYVELRKKQIDFQAGYVYSTPRTLLAVVRLAQAMARVRFSTEVDQSDVDEALRVMEESQSSVLESMNEKSEKKLRKEDTTSIIYQLIKNMCQYDKDKSASYEEIMKKVDIRGFKKDDLEAAVKKYQQIGVLMYSRESNTITLLN